MCNHAYMTSVDFSCLYILVINSFCLCVPYKSINLRNSSHVKKTRTHLLFLDRVSNPDCFISSPSVLTLTQHYDVETMLQR